jgi:hypothetical protein
VAGRRDVATSKLARLKKLLELLRVVFKKTSEIGQDLDRVGAEMIFDASMSRFCVSESSPNSEKNGRAFR